jgi:hypothetical protein
MQNERSFRDKEKNTFSFFWFKFEQMFFSSKQKGSATFVKTTFDSMAISIQYLQRSTSFGRKPSHRTTFGQLTFGRLTFGRLTFG